jgi:hypothetical protein
MTTCAKDGFAALPVSKELQHGSGGAEAAVWQSVASRTHHVRAASFILSERIQPTGLSLTEHRALLCPFLVPVDDQQSGIRRLRIVGGSTPVPQKIPS